MMKYISIKDIIENGAENCTVLTKRPEKGRYIKVNIDEYANCGRGVVEIKYKDEVIVSHFIYPHRDSDEEYEIRLTIGDIKDALKNIKRKGLIL